MNFHHDLKFGVGHKLQFRARMKTVQLKDTEIVFLQNFVTLGIENTVSTIQYRTLTKWDWQPSVAV